MAAGKGTRMKSNRPKVLHRLAGRALLSHVLDTAARLGARRVVVVTGHGAREVEAAARTWPMDAVPDTGAGANHAPAGPEIRFVRQEPQLGTGHAVRQAVPAFGDDAIVLILSGDVPLIDAATLRGLIDACAGTRLALLTISLDDPRGYGRVLRAQPKESSEGAVVGIVEQKDASDDQQAIREVYMGMMAAPAKRLKGWLARLDNQNAQAEFYLTDVVRLAVADGVEVVAEQTDDAMQVAGINSPAQLAALERQWQLRQADALMAGGVRLADPARFDLRGTLRCEADVEIDVNCVFEGDVSLAAGVRIGANCVITNARIEAGAEILAFTHIDGGQAGGQGGVRVGAGARVGPFARLRPGAVLGAEVHIGNFVEIKNSTLADGAKANHLAYLGDAIVGERVNFGAGSITANYDGVNKHVTRIGDDVHVGSNCVLIAPLTLGAGGTVGAGSTLSKSTEPGVLTLTRAKALTFDEWQRPKKKPRA